MPLQGGSISSSGEGDTLERVMPFGDKQLFCYGWRKDRIYSTHLANSHNPASQLMLVT